MFPASLPFDYVRHFDRRDRVRRIRVQQITSRVRRPEPRVGLKA
jgi:hypothetical protein